MQFLCWPQPDAPAMDLDRILANPIEYRQLPDVVWAYDPGLGACRRVQWSNPKEPREMRRTALAVARVEAVDCQGS
jgi:hypothetical protein